MIHEDAVLEKEMRGFVLLRRHSCLPALPSDQQAVDPQDPERGRTRDDGKKKPPESGNCHQAPFNLPRYPAQPARELVNRWLTKSGADRWIIPGGLAAVRGFGLHPVARPCHLDHGAGAVWMATCPVFLGVRAIGKAQIGAGSFQQRLGDEQTKPHAFVARAARIEDRASAAHERLADPGQNMLRIAAPVIHDPQADMGLGPAAFDPDIAAREIDGILYQVPKAMDHLGAAMDGWLAVERPGRRDMLEMDRLAAIRMRVGGFFYQGGQRRLAQVQIVLAGAAHRPKDIAAAIRLFADENGILTQLFIV